MTDRDLQHALHELADRVEATHVAHAAALPLATIAARARRNRHRRTAMSLVGAAAAVVLIGGTAYAVLPDQQAPTPPAVSPAPTPTETPTSTSTPTVASVVLPTGDPELTFGACGSLSSAATAFPSTGAVDTGLTSTASVSQAGDRVPVRGWVEQVDSDIDRMDGPESDFTDDAVPAAVPDGGPRVAIIHEGVVVGTTGFAVDEGTELVVRDGLYSTSTAFYSALPLTVCQPASGETVSTGSPLPAGSYELVPWANVVADPAAGDANGRITWDDALAAPEATAATVRGQALSLQIEGAAEANALRQVVTLGDPPLVDQPACGSDLPVPVPSTGHPFVVTVAPEATTMSADSELGMKAPISLHYNGPGRLRTSMPRPYFWFVQKGVIVGSDWPPYGLAGEIDLGYGAATGDLSLPLRALSCVEDPGAEDAAPLPPGDYQVYPALGLASTEQWGDDGSPLHQELEGLVFGEPFDLTIS